MSTIENIEEEKLGEQDFPPQYSKIKEGKRDLDETKAPEWKDAKIKTKEINIAKEGDPKMAKIGDYWSEQQKAWHDRNIKTKNIAVCDLVLLYDNKVKGKP